MVTDKEMGKVLETVLSGGGDFAELFLKIRTSLILNAHKKY